MRHYSEGKQKPIITFYFTGDGEALFFKLRAALPEYSFAAAGTGKEERIAACKEAFFKKQPLLFIGAVGIAVRTISPFVEDKLKDPPVVAMDQSGQFAIPILSGHMGGANELAVDLANAIGAVPVITTATDLKGAFSPDLFAKERGLSVVNREGIAKISTKALEKKAITLCIKKYPPNEPVDIIVSDDYKDDRLGTLALRYNKRGHYVLGIGCKKGKSKDEILSFLQRVLSQNGIARDEIRAIATIDIKKEEPGILAISKEWSLPLLAFDAGLLNEAKGDFSGSDFVKQTTGTDNVCERAAVLGAGSMAELVVKKQAFNGITIAVAKKEKM